MKKPKNLKIIFFGTPKIGQKILEELVQASYQPIAVVTREDKPAGRGKKPTSTPVKLAAGKYRIPVFQPTKLKGNLDFIKQLKKMAPDLCVVAAYGKIIPSEILELPKYGVLNVHPSLLPKFRGPSPIQFAILQGEDKTGVTIIKMSENLDEGDMLSQSEISIGAGDTTLTLSEKLSKLGAKLLIATIPKWIEGKFKPQPQNHIKATYTAMLTKYDGKIDLENPPEPAKFNRMVRAFYPWPTVWTQIRTKNSKLKTIKFLPGNLIQPEGKKPMTVAEFRNGHPETFNQLNKILKPGKD